MSDTATAGERYAVIEKVSVTIPGDARSRSNPGHGYPEHTSTSETFREFPTRGSWEAYVTTAKRRGTNFRAIVFREAVVEVAVHLVVP